MLTGMSTALVIGAGVGGLTAARDLRRAGIDVTVLEASPLPGGAIRRGSINSSSGDVVAEVGADAFAVNRPEARHLISELGLDHLLVEPTRSDARLVLDHGTFLLPAGVMGIPADLHSDEVRAVIGHDLDEVTANDVDSSTAVSLGALVEAHMGPDVVRWLVDPVTSGVHAIPAYEVEADSVVPGLRRALAEQGSLSAAVSAMRRGLGPAGSAVASLRGGISTMIEALSEEVRSHGVEVRTNTTAVRITRSHGWDVTVESPQGTHTIHADHVVLAVPAAVAATLLDQPSTRHLTGLLSGMSSTSVVVVTLALDAPALAQDPLGSGALIARGHHRIRAKAATHATAKWGWLREQSPAEIVRLSYGSFGMPERLTDDELISQALADLHALVPDLVVTAHAAEVTHWAGSLVAQTLGHTERVRTLRSAVAQQQGLALIGSSVGGNGIAGVIATARTEVARLLDTAFDTAIDTALDNRTTTEGVTT
jgi:protoporphyrinogen/coproporphyrinogen III oxidase